MGERRYIDGSRYSCRFLIFLFVGVGRVIAQAVVTKAAEPAICFEILLHADHSNTFGRADRARLECNKWESMCNILIESVSHLCLRACSDCARVLLQFVTVENV